MHILRLYLFRLCYCPINSLPFCLFSFSFLLHSFFIYTGQIDAQKGRFLKGKVRGQKDFLGASPLDPLPSFSLTGLWHSEMLPARNVCFSLSKPEVFTIKKQLFHYNRS